MLLLLLASVLSATLAYCYKATLFGASLDRIELLLVPIVLLIVVNGINVPACRTMYLNVFSDAAGTAAGVAGLMMAGSMAVGSSIASAAWDGTPRSFYATLTCTMLAAQLWFWTTLGLRSFSPAAPGEASFPEAAPIPLPCALSEGQVACGPSSNNARAISV